MLARKLLSGKSLLAGLALGVSLLAGCGTDKTDPVPSFGGPELYPLRVGDYRTFAVADTTWQLNVPTVSTYQLREVVADSFPGPGRTLGKPDISYRIVRARRATAAEAWREDSVFVLTPLPQALLLSRANRRTVELLFPVRADREPWNRLVFDVQEEFSPDSSRLYRRVGEPVTLRLPGGQTRSYERSVRTYDPDEENALYQRTYEQVYVPSVGPVHRRRRNLSTYRAGTLPGEQIPDPNFIFEGSTHQEVLLEKGRL